MILIIINHNPHPLRKKKITGKKNPQLPHFKRRPPLLHQEYIQLLNKFKTVLQVHRKGQLDPTAP